jgi:outer membrane protein TolC
MKSLIISAFLIGSIALAPPAHSEISAIADIMERAVSGAPSVEAARADMERARATAQRLRMGPYGYELNASGGQRKIDDPLASENRYTEWSAGVSRTIRMPAKRQIDAELARIEDKLAHAALEQVLFQERQQFSDLWSTWLQADLLTMSSKTQAEQAERLAELEQVTVDKGAGRQVRADQLLAEANLLRLQSEQDRLQAENARAALVMRYPTIAIPARAQPLDLTNDEIARILEAPSQTSPIFQHAQLLVEQARLRARRARSEETPDPTVGLDFSNEFGGGETSLMARVTIPLGGSSRRAATREMTANATVAELNAITLERQLQQTIDAARQSLRMSIVLRARAETAVASSGKVLETIEKGYALGEVTITDLLNSHRSYISAQRTLAQQRAATETHLLSLIVLTGGSASGDPL